MGTKWSIVRAAPTAIRIRILLWLKNVILLPLVVGLLWSGSATALAPMPTRSTSRITSPKILTSTTLPTFPAPPPTINTDITTDIDTSTNANANASNNVRRIPWLIVGGGIHGVHVSARLLGKGLAKADELIIVDDATTLLHSWKFRTAATGMEYLRSSAGYHLDLKEHSLRTFAAKQLNNSRNTRVVLGPRSKLSDLLFTRDYERPRLDLFNQHCDAVIRDYELDDKHVKGRVTNLEPQDGGGPVRVTVQSQVVANIDVDGVTGATNKKQNDATVSTITTVFIADQVVLALGNDGPSYPDWVTEDLLHSGKVRHLLDTNTSIPHLGTRSDDGNTNADDADDDVNDGSDSQKVPSSSSKVIAIVGGGITAAHKALQGAAAAARQQDGTGNTSTIHLISRNPLVEQQFDTHQDWMMDQAAAQRSFEGGGAGLPERQKVFQCTCCLQERRRIIARERIPGTITAATNRGHHGLQYAIQNDRVRWHQAEVISLSIIESNCSNSSRNDDATGANEQKCTLSLSSGLTLDVDQVLLATGFGKRPPPLIQTLLDTTQLKLPVSDFCGYPVVDSDLRWGNSSIFVTGALAELELGPSARNIAGARLAAERIVMQASSSKSKNTAHRD